EPPARPPPGPTDDMKTVGYDGLRVTATPLCPRSASVEGATRAGIVLGLDPQEYAVAPLARGDAVDGGDVDLFVRESLQISVGGADLVFSLDQESFFDLAQPPAFLGRRPSYGRDVVGDQVDLCTSGRVGKSGEGEQAHARVFERTEDPAPLPGPPRNLQSHVLPFPR